MKNPVSRGRLGVGSVRFEHVTKAFSRRRRQPPVKALNMVDLEVGPCEAVGIIGPNGAGKSTLLRVAAGITAPTEGQVQRRGSARAVIELGAGIHTDLTGRENIGMLAFLHGMSERQFRENFNNIVEFSGLNSVLDHPTRTYSTGMVGRLSFSVAIHSSPDLLLLDEVLSVGDLSFQEQCRDRLIELRSQGTTLLVVSHDLEFVASLCDRAVLLVAGSVEAEGPVDKVVARYLGLPESGTSDPRLSAALVNPRVQAGEPLVLDLHCELSDSEVSELRVDLVIRDHPTFQAIGERLDVVFGSTKLDIPSNMDSHLEISTDGLPSSRFEVVVVATLLSGETLSSQSMPFSVVGPSGPLAIHLPAALHTPFAQEGPAP